jgi:3-oxoacyl-[acyl-carrier protein] reductase
MLTLDLSNKLALVTGGAGQIGRVIVRTLAECEADVAIHYNSSEEKANELVEELTRQGRRAMPVQADVGDLASVLAMRDKVVAELGAPDIIVNNAVAQYHWVPVLEQPEADFESQYRTCVLQNVFMAKAFVPAMQAKGWGRVIAINTECAMLCDPSSSAYVAGKRGMDGVLRVLAREVGPDNITVNQVAPGWVVTERARAEGKEHHAEYEARMPMRRRSTDQDVANAVAFLASDLACNITGLYLPVASGAVMPRI